MSFLHKPGTHVTKEYFYAFTFPFTYTDCQNQLNEFDIEFQKTDEELAYIVKRLSARHVPLRSPISSPVQSPIQSPTTDQSITTVVVNSNDDNGNCATTSMAKLNKWHCKKRILELRAKTLSDLESDIYYHRELLIESLEGRKVELLTITSFHGIQLGREQIMPNLFPENKRCHSFIKSKKVGVRHYRI